MAPTSQARELIDRARALVREADALSQRARHMLTRGQVSDVAFTARQQFHALVKSGSEAEVLASANAILDVQAARLKRLQQLLDSRGEDAAPPGDE